MTLQTITNSLQNSLQNGQLILRGNNFGDLNLADLLGILNSPSLTIFDAAIRPLENTVTLTGKAVILGSEPIGLDIIFTENGDTVDLALIANAPTGQIPGATWLPIANWQLALRVTGNQLGGTLSGVLLPNAAKAVAFTLSVDVGETTTWQSELPALSLSTVTDLFLNANSPPQDVPDFVFSTLALQITPATGEFSLTATINSDWDFTMQALGVQVALAVNRMATQINASLTIDGAGPLVIADEFSLQSLSFDFSYNNGDWLLSGLVAITLFEEALTLSASYDHREGRRLLMLSLVADGSIELINLSNTGRFALSSLAMTLEQSTAGEPSNWQLLAAGGIQLENVLNLQGALSLSQDTDTTRLGFSPDLADVIIPLPPSQASMLRLGFGEVSIVRQGSADQGQTRWAFDAAIDIAFEGWHESVYRVLPSQIKGQFHADNEQITVRADRAVNAIDLVIPDININDLTIPLGAVRVDVVNLAIRFDSDISLSADIGLGLPSNLNNLFGVGGNGEPALAFFQHL